MLYYESKSTFWQLRRSLHIILYLLKLIIENIAGIECHSLKVLNPDLNPQHVEDKDMNLDIRVTNEDGEICDVEMQNSSLDRQQYQRFQIYGAKLLVEQEKRGDDYVSNIHHVFQLIFIDDVDKDNLVLIDRYISQNESGNEEKYYLMTRIYIYLPYINILKKEKGIENFNELETAIYIFKNGIDDDIMRVKKKVVDIMEKKVDKFNEDMILQDMAFNRDLNRQARHARMKQEREEGKEEGLTEGKKLGVSEGKKEFVLKLFTKSYPRVETKFLNQLSVEQYEKIFDLLIEKASLEKIYEAADCIKE
ncbi:PD-(D/E)XK nuclease family transposase [Longibaculum muris]|uniref:PD-(D/E)XK nuclease family transposase n=1 Tax=Longibaculum muris TaxID=1796628 RepID=UPI003AB62FC6